MIAVEPLIENYLQMMFREIKTARWPLPTAIFIYCIYAQPKITLSSITFHGNKWNNLKICFTTKNSTLILNVGITDRI